MGVRIHIVMRGIGPIELTLTSLRAITFPPLPRPRVMLGEARTEGLVQWGTKLYAYSVIAHLRKVLDALVLLARNENVPAANVVSRHIFEWTAHACYMSRKLKDCYRNNDWEQAWSILTSAAIGNLWAKRYGNKYGPPPPQQVPAAPDPVRVGIAVAEYEEYQSQILGLQDAKEDYGLLSELSHPNAACLQQYQTYFQDGNVAIEYVEAPAGASSPLPFVNRSLLDLALFLDQLLGLADETAVRSHIRGLIGEFSRIARQSQSQP
jgi:hypothetical protein